MSVYKGLASDSKKIYETHMILNIVIDEKTLPIKVPESLLTSAEAFFQKIDSDMDKGWQISRDWVDNPTLEQRCQVVADKILGAIETENEKLATMMAAYILSRAPSVKTVVIDTQGEIQETALLTEP
jgi:ribosome maturation protein Sdo1